MIKSMTGYGRGECSTATTKFIVEVRSVNSKAFDMSLRTPTSCRAYEQTLRSAASKVLLRGKVDMMVSVENSAAAPTNTINKELFRSYYRDIVNLSREVGYDIDTEPLMSVLLRMPDVVAGAQEGFDEEQIAALTKATNDALAAIDNFRANEGAVLIADLLARVDTIGNLLSQVDQYEGQRIETVKNRITENLEKLKIEVDKNRFEAEIIYYLEKLDVTEEKVRLAQHLKYFCEVAHSGGDAGRKLGFIAQEMGREINTLGSKANHSDMQRLVVTMKDELEKIKEQLLNIL